MSDRPWIVVRARNDRALIEQTLQALARQHTPHRLIVMDNASTDGTREIAARYADALVDIPEGEYVPGAVLNEAMRRTTGEYVVFLNSDCEATHETWLTNLLAAAAVDATAAVFGRQDPRPGCLPLMAKDTVATFGDGRRQAAWRHCFSMAASCIRRSVWQAMPFSESLRYSEDIDWTWRARQAGYSVRYVPDAVVWHSHNYTAPQLFKRQYGEGFAEATIFEWSAFERSALRYTVLPYLRLVPSDIVWCMARFHPLAALSAPVVRAVMAAGRRAGFRAGLAALTGGPPGDTPQKG